MALVSRRTGSVGDGRPNSRPKQKTGVYAPSTSAAASYCSPIPALWLRYCADWARPCNSRFVKRASFIKEVSKNVPRMATLVILERL